MPLTQPLLLQTRLKVTLVDSRFTHPAESRYAPIEREALAVADALEKSRHFVLGCEDLVIAVDHQPLLKIFGDRSLDNISNTRLRNLKEKTLRYRFLMVHIPGVKNKVLDTLSRHPTEIGNLLKWYSVMMYTAYNHTPQSHLFPYPLSSWLVCALTRKLIPWAWMSRFADYLPLPCTLPGSNRHCV